MSRDKQLYVLSATTPSPRWVDQSALPGAMDIEIPSFGDLRRTMIKTAIIMGFPVQG
ncbi:hypothetical protein [Methylobacterium tardum]|uniref:hypothetical protein n=1 Tax=Methylobacterium tardum TaxID=374432 RepID=UPI001EE0C2AB|nr:hypothetical protein [Methylobacterium tardum]URD40270.1 hypothetical protein M6G65_33275 [Methylobacterium tardum]